MPTEFLDLPPELRNEVYNILWEDTPLFEKYYDVWNSVIVRPSKDTCWNSMTGEDTALPLWLLSCKQIFQEGIAEFLFRSHWTIQSNGRIDLARRPGIFHPSEARHLSFHFFDSLWAEPQLPEGTSASIYYTPDSETIDVLSQWASKTGKARGLHISFTILDDDDEMFYEELDLSRIASIAFAHDSLSELSVSLETEFPHGIGEDFKNTTAREVKRLGSFIMLKTVSDAAIDPDCQCKRLCTTFTIARVAFPDQVILGTSQRSGRTSNGHGCFVLVG